VALVGLVAWCGVACVSEERPSEGSPEAAQRAQPIINGSLDTTRDAVIAILGDQSLCSGTIIQTDPNRGLGWVLTAAHCVDDVPRYVAQGADFNDPDTYYEVVSYEAHPSYDSRDTTYDFAVIVFAGADRSTPVIPAVGASDGLREGGAVTSVGYGRTTPSYAQDTGNTRRRRVNRVISDLYQELIVYNISDAGICQGDSGGPVLANVNGQEKVVGVHSSVSGDCEGEGYSGRVTLVYSTWLVGQLGGEVEPSCELCQQVATSGNGECVPIIEDCNNSRSCSALLECLQNCNTEACSQNCASDNPQGVQEYLAIFDCVCEDACPSECGGTDFCPEPAACGIAFSDETCNNCQERECCAEARDCGDDATCLGCLNGTVTQGCNNNGAFNDYFECLQGGCASECGIDEAPECGFTADGACGECLQGE
jgi:V8-like Glu-specific endopeptidase